MNTVYTECGPSHYDRDTLVVDGKYEPLLGASKILSIQKLCNKTAVSYDNGVVIFPEKLVYPPTKIIEFGLVMLGINPATIIADGEVYTFDLDLSGWYPNYGSGCAIYERGKLASFCYKFISGDMKVENTVYFDLATKTTDIKPHEIKNDGQEIVQILEGNRFVYGFDGQFLYYVSRGKLFKYGQQEISKCRVSETNDTLIIDE